MARPKKEPEKKYIRQNISMDPDQLERLMNSASSRSECT